MSSKWTVLAFVALLAFAGAAFAQNEDYDDAYYRAPVDNAGAQYLYQDGDGDFDGDANYAYYGDDEEYAEAGANFAGAVPAAADAATNAAAAEADATTNAAAEADAATNAAAEADAATNAAAAEADAATNAAAEADAATNAAAAEADAATNAAAEADAATNTAAEADAATNAAAEADAAETDAAAETETTENTEADAAAATTPAEETPEASEATKPQTNGEEDTPLSKVIAVSPQAGDTRGGYSLTVDLDYIYEDDGPEFGITVGGLDCPDVQRSGFSLVCTTPVGAGKDLPVEVTSKNDGMVIARGTWGYQPPTIAYAGFEDDLVAVRGTNFGPKAQVTVDGAPCQVMQQSHTRLSCKLAPDATALGTIQVTVGGQSISHEVNLQLQAQFMDPYSPATSLVTLAQFFAIVPVVVALVAAVCDSLDMFSPSFSKSELLPFNMSLSSVHAFYLFMVIEFFQFIACSAMLNLEYSAVYLTFASKFAWSMFVVPIAGLQSFVNGLRGVNAVVAANQAATLASVLGIPEENVLLSMLATVTLCSIVIVGFFCALYFVVDVLCRVALSTQKRQACSAEVKAHFVGSVLRLFSLALAPLLIAFATHVIAVQPELGTVASWIGAAFGSAILLVLLLSARVNNIDPELLQNDPLTKFKFGPIVGMYQVHTWYFFGVVLSLKVCTAFTIGVSAIPGWAQIVALSCLELLYMAMSFQTKPFASVRLTWVSQIVSGFKLLSLLLLLGFVNGLDMSLSTRESLSYLVLFLNLFVVSVACVLSLARVRQVFSNRSAARLGIQKPFGQLYQKKAAKPTVAQISVVQHSKRQIYHQVSSDDISLELDPPRLLTP